MLRKITGYITVLLIVFTCVLIPGKIVISKDYPGIDMGADSLKSLDAIPQVIDTFPGLLIRETLFRGGLLYDINKNKIVWGKHIHQAFPIASLTKMMVALITVEDIKAGKFDWNAMLKVSKEACKVGGSSVNLRLGQMYTVNDLLQAAMIASGNDACYMLAQWNAGSEKAFVDRMNQKAIELGMKETRYSNCTGMPAGSGQTDNYASPHDLLILATALLRHDEILNISCKPNECIQQGYRSFMMRNHNGLVKEYEEINGLKTGWTNHAGYCIVASANRNGHQMVSIVLGAPKVFVRNSIVASMLNDYYQTIGLGKMGEAIDSTLTRKVTENVRESND
jgi:D-alanyl-D-alanine carboxypeptidase (penicillin-binding protein 5/6)